MTPKKPSKIADFLKINSIVFDFDTKCKKYTIFLGIRMAILRGKIVVCIPTFQKVIK